MKNFPISDDGQALTATAVSAAQAFSAAAVRVAVATDVVIHNPGPLPIRVRTGSAGVAAGAQSMLVPPNSVQAFAKGNATHIAAVTESGSQPFTVWLGQGSVLASAAAGGDVIVSGSGRRAGVVYEEAPPAYNQQQLATTVIDHDNYKAVPAGSTNMVLAQSGLGAIGDFLTHVIVSVDDPATSAVVIKDGLVTVFSLPANRSSGMDHSTLPTFGSSKNGAWNITTGAGVSCYALGRF